MPLSKHEVEINKAVLSIELARAEMRKIPLMTDTVWKAYYNSAFRHLRSATTRLNKIITAEAK